MSVDEKLGARACPVGQSIDLDRYNVSTIKTITDINSCEGAGTGATYVYRYVYMLNRAIHAHTQRWSTCTATLAGTGKAPESRRNDTPLTSGSTAERTQCVICIVRSEEAPNYN